jgi:hypothetical protein
MQIFYTRSNINPRRSHESFITSKTIVLLGFERNNLFFLVAK